MDATRRNLTDAVLDLVKTAPAGGSSWWTAANDRCARCRERNLLSAANGLPVAHASIPVSTLGNGLLLLSMLETLWNQGAIGTGPWVVGQFEVFGG